jgi:hypothetical protein
VPIRYFRQLAFSQVFSRANPGIVDEQRLKTRAAQEIKLGNVSTRLIVDREGPASILCEGPSSFSASVMTRATGGAEVRRVLVSANVSAEPGSPLPSASQSERNFRRFNSPVSFVISE